MAGSTQDYEADYARAFRQLAADHQAGRLSTTAYRRLRRALLEAAESGAEIVPVLTGQIPAGSRAGWVVRLALAGIVVLLLLVGWLFR